MFYQLNDLEFAEVDPSGKLYISGTQDGDAGDYECRATNEAGTNNAFVRLEIGG